MSSTSRERVGAVTGGTLAVAGALVGVLAYVAGDAHARHDPAHALQQLDLLYLDEPAPEARALGLEPGRVAVVVFCPGPCALPDLRSAQVVRSTDRELAARYALSAGDRVGYALVDRRGRVRYRSYDPALAHHEPELQVLVDALAEQP